MDPIDAVFDINKLITNDEKTEKKPKKKTMSQIFEMKTKKKKM
jgi:hypothetical protein